jgi:hypothetical protein
MFGHCCPVASRQCVMGSVVVLLVLPGTLTRQWGNWAAQMAAPPVHKRRVTAGLFGVWVLLSLDVAGGLDQLLQNTSLGV